MAKSHKRSCKNSKRSKRSCRLVKKCSKRRSPRRTRANPKKDNRCLGMKKGECSLDPACNWGKRSGCKRRPVSYKGKGLTYAL